MSDRLTRRHFLRAVSAGAAGLGMTTQFSLDAFAARQAWKAGLAQVVITPQKPLWMAGYAVAQSRPKG